MLRLELLKVKADLERELKVFSLNGRKYGLDVHWVSGLGITPGHWGAPAARAATASRRSDREWAWNYRAWLSTPCQRGFGFTRSVRIVRPEHICVGTQLGIVGAGAPVYREDYG